MLIGIKYELFDEQRLYLLKHKVDQIRKSHAPHIQAKIDESFWGHPLRLVRTNDNDRVVSEILSELIYNNNHDYQKANEMFLAIDSIEMESIILNTIYNLIRLDYYYSYEKQW